MSKVYILPPEPTHEGYVEAIKAAAAQLDRDADKIIGDLDGKRKIEVSILFDPDSIPTISVKTDYLIGREYEVRIGED